ncbi:hypothetical protein ACE01N_09270 [Saccharicrinis sp. FJH2]|uniref:hypothetical protein n=1 Tax=Saccharicrinis sp. FJH65 TaxID=3344659 RepID=UPI0035F452E3
MKTKTFLLLLTLFFSLHCFGTEPTSLVQKDVLLYYSTNYSLMQDSVINTDNELLLRNAGLELIKAERKLYLGVSFMALGGVIYRIGQGDKKMNVLGIGLGAFGALFSLEYVYHVGNAGRILNGISTKAGSGLRIKSDENGIGLAFRF